MDKLSISELEYTLTKIKDTLLVAEPEHKLILRQLESNVQKMIEKSTINK